MVSDGQIKEDKFQHLCHMRPCQGKYCSNENNRFCVSLVERNNKGKTF